MTGFTQFYIRFLEQLWNNVCYFFDSVGELFARVFYKDWAVNGYYQLFIENSASWNILDYVAFIFVLIVNVGFVALIVFFLFLLLKRYVRFTRKEIDKDTLVIEIGPGAGTLTKVIAQKANSVVSYEIDKNLEPVLKENLNGVTNSKIIFADALKEPIKNDFNLLLPSRLIGKLMAAPSGKF